VKNVEDTVEVLGLFDGSDVRGLLDHTNQALVPGETCAIGARKRRFAFTSRTAAARASASSSLERRMWKARRWALLAPTPGSFFSSSIRRDIGSANFDMERLV
jgi:hypothetical protein